MPEARVTGTVGYPRLNRVETLRRKNRKQRARTLGSLILICLAIYIFVISGVGARRARQGLTEPAGAAVSDNALVSDSATGSQSASASDSAAGAEGARENHARPDSDAGSFSVKAREEPRAIPTEVLDESLLFARPRAEEEYTIEWHSYYVEHDSRVPVHYFPVEASDIVGSIEPGAVVYGFKRDDGWISIADARDIAYYVKSEYLKPFGKEKSEISFFRDDHERLSGGFTINSNINTISGLSLDDICFLLKAYPGFAGIEEHVLLCERIYGVNAYFILGVASQESGFGSSKLASSKNNLFGIGAYDANSYESGLSFSSKTESVEYFCALIARYHEDGRKSPADINPRYATDEEWASKVVIIMNIFSSQIRDRGQG